MRFLVDENLSSPRLAFRLQAQGHDPVLASDVGLLSVTDARVLIFSIAQTIPVLTRDSEDFESSPRRSAEPSHARFGSSQPECVLCPGTRTLGALYGPALPRAAGDFLWTDGSKCPRRGLETADVSHILEEGFASQVDSARIRILVPAPGIVHVGGTTCLDHI